MTKTSLIPGEGRIGMSTLKIKLRKVCGKVPFRVGNRKILSLSSQDLRVTLILHRHKTWIFKLFTKV